MRVIVLYPERLKGGVVGQLDGKIALVTGAAG